MSDFSTISTSPISASSGASSCFAPLATFSSGGAIILAAGKGTRMHSTKPKVLQTILDEPMLLHILQALQPLFGDRIWVVIGHGAELVRAKLAGYAVHFVEQTEQLGTGHALGLALPELVRAGIKQALVINGDTPLVSAEFLSHFWRDAEGADISVATLTLPKPGAYGRIVRHQGRVVAIVEAKDFSVALHGQEPNEVNSGLYLLKVQAAEELLPLISNQNANKEYYLTDLVSLAVAKRLVVTGLDCGSNLNLLGVNTPLELVKAEELCRAQIVNRHLEAGVLIHNPDAVRIGPFVQLAPGVELVGPGEIYGHSCLQAGVFVHSHCYLKDVDLAENTVVHNFSHLVKAKVGQAAQIGPYARLRPGAQLAEAVHIGNFVEVKKSQLGVGSKANHLSYIGDSQIGAGVNVGAGTITCNYDGVHKHKTTIEDRVFIGSNTALVAPVTVHEGAIIGAGSVITKDVPAETLGVARSKQVNLKKKF